MIGHLKGEVLFSDGTQVIIAAKSGVGYEVSCGEILVEGSETSLYISHVIRENAEDLFGFKTLREKKLFELLRSVKGVGPKSAYSLLMTLGFENTIFSIQNEDKKALSKAPGVGPKAAAQVILDLQNKLEKVLMYSDSNHMGVVLNSGKTPLFESSKAISNDSKLIGEALMACQELGFKENQVGPVMERLLQEHAITKSEQLVHLVLKEL